MSDSISQDEYEALQDDYAFAWMNSYREAFVDLAVDRRWIVSEADEWAAEAVYAAFERSLHLDPEQKAQEDVVVIKRKTRWSPTNDRPRHGRAVA